MTGSPTVWDACGAGDADAVRARLAAGADPNARDERGATPLHVACAAEVPAGHRAEVVRALLDAGACPFALDDEGGAITCADERTSALLRTARGSGRPTPALLFVGREHPLMHYFTDALPESAALADKVCCVEVRVEGAPSWPTPFTLVPETSPDVPFGVPIVLRLGVSTTRIDRVRSVLLPGVGVDRWKVSGGPHNDARFDDCRLALSRHREVIRIEDLRRKDRTCPRPVQVTFDALDALFANRAEVVWSRWRERHPPTTVPREAWERHPERGVFGRGEAYDLEVFGATDCDHDDEGRARYDPVADVLWGDFLTWNEIDERFARSLLRRGDLQRLEDVVAVESAVVDTHARLRDWYTRAGIPALDQLRAALFSARFCREFPGRGMAPSPADVTGRELWVATRPIDDLVAALTTPPPLEDPAYPSSVDRSAALGRLLVLLDRTLGLPWSQARARELWERVRHRVWREDVASWLALDPAHFASWIVPRASTARGCARALASLPSRARPT